MKNRTFHSYLNNIALHATKHSGKEELYYLDKQREILKKLKHLRKKLRYLFLFKPKMELINYSKHRTTMTNEEKIYHYASIYILTGNMVVYKQ
jgi:negative regulator of genetic competence, sporulation and motility